MGTNSVSSWHRWATPAALSNSALLWYIPGGVTGVVFSVPLVERGAPDRLTWLVIALLSQGAFSGLVLLTRLVAPRLISKPVAILLTLILAGGVRGVVIYLLASSWQPMGFGVSPVFQILTSAVMSTAWMGALGYLIQANKNYRATFETLFWQAVAAQRSLVTPSTRKRSEVVDEVARTRAAILEDLETIDASKDYGRQLHEASEMLHEAVEQQIRPLSHQLWAEQKVRPPAIRFGALLFDAISNWDPPLRAIAVLLTAVIGVGTVRSAGLVIGFEVAVISVTTAILVLLVRALLIARHPHWRGWVSPLVVVVLPVAVGLSLEVIANKMMGIRPDPSGSMIVAISIPVIVVIATAIAGVQAERNLIISSLQLRIDMAQVDEVAVMQIDAEHDAQMGTYLHHRVQSELTALALQLEQASRQYDEVSALQVVNSARERLSRSLDGDSIENSDTGRVRLAQIPEDWSGIAVVELTLPSGDFGSATQWQTAALIADEAVGNAVRSGGAGQISVQVEVSESALVLVVTDNGGGVSASAKGGMGSAWLDMNAPGRWSRESTPAGTKLTVEVTA